MSTPNFRTQKNFPLWCIDDSDMEWWEAKEFYKDMQEDIDEQNDKLTFFRIAICSGYYVGAQLYIEMQNYAEEAGFDVDGAENIENEYRRYYLDMCRSEAIRKYEAEQRKVCRLMKKIGERWGFEQYYCTAIFSNGEAIYEKANKRTRMISVVRGYATA